MARYGLTLRSFYSRLENVLYHDSQHERDVPDDIMDVADQKGFAQFEVQLASRAQQNYDFDTHDPALRRAVQGEVRSHMAFFNCCSTVNEDDGQLRDDGIGEFDELDDFDELGYEESRRVRHFNDPPHLPWSPNNTRTWRSIADQLTRFHKLFEQNKQLNAMVGSSGRNDILTGFGNSHVEARRYKVLYDLLVNAAVCSKSCHSALLQLQNVDQTPMTVDMYLSCAPGEPVQGHRTSIEFDRQGPTQRFGQSKTLDICSRIHPWHTTNRRRLYLVFDDNDIRLKRDPNPEVLPRTSTKPLSNVLESTYFDREELEVILKKSHLALELALSIYRFYASPWIQTALNADTIELVYEEELTTYKDFGCVCIPCDLGKVSPVPRDIWREPEMVGGTGKTSSDFFLSFAQLLVDIILGNGRQVSSAEGLHASLLEVADTMMKDDLMKGYGEAVLACVQFGLDYKLAKDLEFRSRSDDSTAIARRIILDSIIRNLRKHFYLWKSQYDHQLSGFSDHNSSDEIAENLEEGTSPHTDVLKIPHRREIEKTASYFTLFAPGDEQYEKQRPGSQLGNEFEDLMKGFKTSFMIPALRQCGKKDIKPVVIAVLDTGVRKDNKDGILDSGYDRRVCQIRSRNYFDHRDDWGGWDIDDHGHGTHIVRILLQNTVSAQILVLKVAKERKTKYTPEMLGRFIEALKWAGKHADIINCSIGLDEVAKGELKGVIKDIIVKQRRLIFAAASNSGGNGARAYPAKERGVFAIHATKANGACPDEDMNPPANDGMDNFATLGCGIASKWEGEDVLISGTSFATPIAAAIAANILEFDRLAPIEEQSNGFFSSYSGMRQLLRKMSSKVGNYDYVRPWTEGMFRAEHSISDMREKLQEMSTVGTS